jgi:hypothetical protein
MVGACPNSAIAIRTMAELFQARSRSDIFSPERNFSHIPCTRGLAQRLQRSTIIQRNRQQIADIANVASAANSLP